MQHPLLETFPLSHPQRHGVERSCALKFEKVGHEERGPLGNCYWNVQSLLNEEGGSILYGWQILIWPKLYVEALHHAVWQKPDGYLLDVTAKYPTDNRVYSTFARDDSITPDLTHPIFIPSRNFIIRNCAEVRHLLDVSRDQLDRKRRLMEGARARGIVWSPTIGLNLAGAPDLHALAMLVDADLDRMTEAMIACRNLGGGKRKHDS